MVYIKGVGMTKFNVDQRSSYERIYECVNEALEIGNVILEEIDAIFVSNSEGESNGERQKHVGPMISSMFQRKLPIVEVPAGCGGGGAASASGSGNKSGGPSQSAAILSNSVPR